VDAGLADDATASRPALEVLQGGGEGGEATAAVDLEERRRARRAAERSRLTVELEQARAELRTADRQVAVLTARQEEVVEGIADLERRLATARGRLEKVTAELEEASGIRDRAEERETSAAKALDEHESS
jgi:chromosome segregation ATPase